MLNPVPRDRFHQRFRADTSDRLFARCVNVEHLDRVRIIKTSCELAHQVARARITVRLEYHVQPRVAASASGAERGTYLRRMMPIVVDNIDSAR